MRVWKKNESIMGTRVQIHRKKMTKVKLKLNIIPEMNWRGSLICSNLSDRRQNERDF